MQEIPVLGASQKLEFQKKRNSNFLNAEKPSAWSFSKLEFQKKRNSNFLNAEQPSSWSFSKIRVPKKSFHAKKQRAREANPNWHLRNQEQLFACRRGSEEMVQTRSTSRQND